MIEARLNALRSRAAYQQAQKDALRNDVRNLEQRLEVHKKNIELYHETRDLLLKAAEVSRKKTIDAIEKVVTSALRAVFQDRTMSFGVNVRSTARSGLEADYVVRWKENGLAVEADPLHAKGGSLVDVISTALKLVFLHTYRPKKRQVLWLDEPGKDLDAQRLPRYAKWIRTVSHEFGIQVNIITHEDEIISAGDRIHRLKKTSKGVKVTQEEGQADLSGYGFHPDE